MITEAFQFITAKPVPRSSKENSRSPCKSQIQKYKQEKKSPNQISFLPQLGRGEVSNKIIQGESTQCCHCHCSQLCLHGMERGSTATMQPGKPKFHPISTNPGYKYKCETAEQWPAPGGFLSEVQQSSGQEDNMCHRRNTQQKKESGNSG